MHTSPAYAEDVYVGALNGVDDRRAQRQLYRAGRRRPASPRCAARSRRATPSRVHRAADPSASTSSTARCGSTTCSSRGSGCSWSSRRPSRSPPGCCGTISTAGSPRPSSRSAWRWRLADAMGLKEHQPTVEYVVDLVAEVQTVRACLDRRRARPGLHRRRQLLRQLHPPAARRPVAPEGATAHQRNPAHRAGLVAGRGADRQRPRRPGMAAGLEESFGGGGYTARSAPRCCSSRPTMSRRRSTAANRPSNCMPAAASRRGAAGLRQRLPELQRAGQRGAARDRHADAGDRCRRIPAAPLAPRRPNMAPPAKPPG